MDYIGGRISRECCYCGRAHYSGMVIDKIMPTGEPVRWCCELCWWKVRREREASSMLKRKESDNA